MKTRTLALLLLFVACAATARAADNSWTDGSSEWQIATNWSRATAPSVNDSSDLITNTGSHTVVIDALTTGASPGTMTISNLTVSAPGGSTNTLFSASAGTNIPLHVLNTAVIGSGGFLNVSDFAMLVDGLSGGGFNIDGSASLLRTLLVATNTTVAVGFAGSGTMTLVTGRGQFGNLYVGDLSASSGTLNLYGGTNSILSTLSIGGHAGTGTGVVWMLGDELINTNGSVLVGDNGVGQMTVSNGTVLAANISVGNNAGSQGTLTAVGGQVNVTSNLDVGVFSHGTGSVWVTGGQMTVTNSKTHIGTLGVGQMTVSNGTWRANQVFVGVGPSNGSGNGAGGTLTAAGGVSTISSSLTIGEFGNVTGTVWATGGQLVVTNGPTIVGGAGLGQMIVSNGTVTATTLIVTNHTNGSAINTNLFTLNGGVVNSAGAAITNGLVFLVGDGTHGATYHLLGGVHSFANGLRVHNHGEVSGCGTINGNVVVDVGGGVLADCGGSLTFTGILTNNGTMRAINGSVLEAYGAVVNNGLIDLTGGSTNFHSTFVNNGTVWIVATNSWTAGTGKWESAGNWLAGTPSPANPLDLITNSGNATVTMDATTVLSNSINGCMTINNLTVSAPGGSTNTLFLNNAGTTTPLSIQNSFSINAGGALVVTNANLQMGGVGGTFTVDGGQATFLNDSSAGISQAEVGFTLGSAGTLTFAGGEHAAVFDIGSYATGTVWVTGAEVDGFITIGSMGLLIQSNGTVSAGLTQGPPGMEINGGKFMAAGGTANLGELDVYSPADLTTTGAVWVTGGLLQVFAPNCFDCTGNQGGIAIGFSTLSETLSLGSLTQSNGTVQANGESVVNGTLTIAGGTNVVVGVQGGIGGANLFVGFSGGTGMVWVTGGQLVATNVYETNFGFFDSGIVFGDGGTGAGTLVQSNGMIEASVEVVNSGTLTVAGGTHIVGDQGLQVGIYTGGTGAVWVTGGQLISTNSPTLIGPQGLGQMTVSNGTVTLSSFVATINTNGSVIDTNVFILIGGVVNSGGATNANGLVFADGDGTHAATYHLLGGIHSFANGLRVRNNGTLSGCGTISGNVTVDSGGLVLADCGGSLTFSGILTNNGTMKAVNSSVLEGYGLVVNNGTIDITGGSTNFHGGFINNGTIITGASPAPFEITGIVKQGSDMRITWQTPVGSTNALQATAGTGNGSYSTNNFAAIFIVTNAVGTLTNYLDVGGATNFPARFYRVRLVP